MSEQLAEWAQIALGLGLGVPGAMAAWRAARSFYVAARPDEWLLCVRDGRLVHAGVGTSMFRRPGDVVVRFSSTMQRVAFALDATSSERVGVRIEGFIFWSVAPDGDAPFRAYSRLGIADLRAPPSGLKHPRHLLTSPQHKAFQQILSAVVQRHASTLTLDALVGQQDELVRGLSARLRDVTEEMGVQINQVEILVAKPSDESVRAQLSVAETERLREAAGRVRRAVQEREIADERGLELARLASEHALKLRAIGLERERALAGEEGRAEESRARAAREREETDARLLLVRAEAEAARDAELSRSEALERMSPAVREHERQVLIAQKVSETLRVTDARWISMGPQSPAASVGAMIAGLREVLDGSKSPQ